MFRNIPRKMKEKQDPPNKISFIYNNDILFPNVWLSKYLFESNNFYLFICEMMRRDE